MRNERAESLDTTDLVNEVYLKLHGSEQSWEDKSHFFSAAAESMRRILVDRARRRKAMKRGGGKQRVELADTALASFESPDEILIVNDLFDAFAKENPKEAETAKLRYFANFTLEEVAAALGISTSTAHRHWEFARAWIYKEVRRTED